MKDDSDLEVDVFCPPGGTVKQVTLMIRWDCLPQGCLLRPGATWGLPSCRRSIRQGHLPGSSPQMMVHLQLCSQTR